MITEGGTSYGFGRACGRPVAPENLAGTLDHPEVAVFVQLPSADGLLQVARQPGCVGCVLPILSPYSHLAAAAWSSGLPVLSVERPGRLLDGAQILVDCDAFTVLAYDPQENFAFLEVAVDVPAGLTRPSGAIRVLAELSDAADVVEAERLGADGIGVLNVETILRARRRGEWPTFLRGLEQHPGWWPLSVRFFDEQPRPNLAVGGPPPVLGYRGVRLLELDPQLLDEFLQVIADLPAEDLAVILPMVVEPHEVRRFRALVSPLKVGITLETPAAALMAREFAPLIDHAELGLNDLTQYTMAWDRNTPHSSRLPPGRIAEPVALLIAAGAKACSQAGVPCTLGLDLMPVPELAAQLSDLGVTAISCPTPLVGRWIACLAG